MNGTAGSGAAAAVAVLYGDVDYSGSPDYSSDSSGVAASAVVGALVLDVVIGSLDSDGTGASV